MNSYKSIEEAIKGTFGENVSLSNDLNITGSRFNSTRTLDLSNGERVFLKVSEIGNLSTFDAEEEGINAIASTKAIGVPKLYCKGTDKERRLSFLMMEVIERGMETNENIARMGYEFADMHLADASDFVKPKNETARYGFLHNNYIGASKQINTPKESWIDFFRECRLEPQFKMAEKELGAGVLKSSIKLMDNLDKYLIEPEFPSLLHGDMWGGNYFIDSTGRAILIDPAAYVGCAEADIAMTELFSPMPRAFYKAYYEKIPIQEGYRDRRDLYNLYHVLNHLNLFGGEYLYAAINTILYYAGWEISTNLSIF